MGTRKYFMNSGSHNVDKPVSHNVDKPVANKSILVY